MVRVCESKPSVRPTVMQFAPLATSVAIYDGAPSTAHSSFEIQRNGHTIKAQSYVKYLGVNLVNFLSEETISNSIIDKVNSWQCSALIQYHLDYSCSIWYAGLNKTLKKKLQDPLVQSVVSLTSSLRVISLTVLADSMHNILIFFAEKIATHIFSAKNFSNILIFIAEKKK